MKKSTYEKLYTDNNYIKYLRENSYWYKNLNRNPESIEKMIEEMKERYGLRFKDKIDKAKTSLDLINAFMTVTKDK